MTKYITSIILPTWGRARIAIQAQGTHKIMKLDSPIVFKRQWKRSREELWSTPKYLACCQKLQWVTKGLRWILINPQAARNYSAILWKWETNAMHYLSDNSGTLFQRRSTITISTIYADEILGYIPTKDVVITGFGKPSIVSTWEYTILHAQSLNSPFKWPPSIKWAWNFSMADKMATFTTPSRTTLEQEKDTLERINDKILLRSPVDLGSR